MFFVVSPPSLTHWQPGDVCQEISTKKPKIACLRSPSSCFETQPNCLILTIVKKSMSCFYLGSHLYLKAQQEKGGNWKIVVSLTSLLSSPLTYDYCNDANWSPHRGPGFLLSGVKWLAVWPRRTVFSFRAIVGGQKQQHPAPRWVGNCNRQVDGSDSTSNAVHTSSRMWARRRAGKEQTGGGGG